MAHAVLSFNEQIERIAEVVAVIAVGTLLWAVEWHRAPGGSSSLLLLLIRPLSVAVGLAGSHTSRSQRALIGWFGIRGIGSLYYLMYAIEPGPPAGDRRHAGRAHALGGRRLDHGAWHLGDAANGVLRAPAAGRERLAA